MMLPEYVKMKDKATGDKYYIAVVRLIGINHVKVCRRKHKRADDALKYGIKFIDKYERMFRDGRV
jgi:hypothetical protein